MHQYGVREVEKLLRLPRSVIRASVEAGFVSPTRGPRNAWQFSFQDLIVLRTAQSLVAANVPKRQINKSVKELRRRLPESMPLSGLSISAVGDRVVVKEGRTRWQADSGQYVLAFEGDPAEGSLSVIERKPPVPAATAEDWFSRGVSLEARGDPEAAMNAYEQAILADPTRPDAPVNLGRLLHESGRLAPARKIYLDALDNCGADPLLLYNLAVLLDDLNSPTDALEAYRAALREDPTLADCHYNMALLCEKLDRRQEAIRHMAQYRRLMATPEPR
jgi:tetratricopeptide (TPR) repeat protein